MVGMVGIDLNGLSDASASPRDETIDIYRGGDVPSVVILPRNDEEARNKPTVIAGEEASLGIEGRGWQWPKSARVDSPNCRVPVIDLLDAVRMGDPIQTSAGVRDAQDLLGATIEALAGPGAQDPDSCVAISIPDDGTYSEEIRQRFLDAAASRAIPATLLWRPVAAFLGMENELRPVADRVVGRKVGVLSLMNEGVQVNFLDVEMAEDDNGAPYLVPVRKGPGISVPYKVPIHNLAARVAHALMPDDPDGAWQVLWGDGLVLRWLLKMRDRQSLVQRADGWSLLDGRRPKNLPQVEMSDTALQDIVSFLEGTRYVIYEGPAREAATAGNNYLVHHLQGVLKSHGMQSLHFGNFQSHLAARGCVAYAQRRMAGQRTYFDYLPKMRLAVRKGTEPEFVDLISSDARVEGGTLFEDRKDLGVSLPAHASEVKFYLLREGAAAPRYVSIDLPARLPESLPVSMTVRQRPAQGFAELALEATDMGSGFASIAVRWSQMEERPGRTEEDILEELGSSGIEVPPVVPQPCHVLAWTGLTGGRSLVDMVLSLERQVSNSPRDSRLLPAVKELGGRLTRFDSLTTLTQGQILDRTRYRAVSSDGDLPEAESGLTAATLATFDRVLAMLSDCLADAACPDDLRSAVVRSVTWTFRRCPEAVAAHLLEAATTRRIPDNSIYYRAMGRCFVEEEGFKAFFDVLEQDVREQGSIKQQRLEGLRYLLSLREKAACAMTAAQAELFANSILDRLEEMVNAGNIARLAREALRTLAAMLRYRVVNSSFVVPGETALGDRLAKVTNKITRRHRGTPAADLAESLQDWAAKRGTDSTILQWEDG